SLHAVLWNGTVGLAPLGHDLPADLAVVPLADMTPSRVVAVCNAGDTNPLIRSFIDTAAAAYRH
ncbi:LysR family transcriptional regulator, partial [Streptomyces sp. NPDC058734]